MFPNTPDTLPTAPSVHPDIVRLERYLPLVLSVHATLQALYSGTMLNVPLWLVFVVVMVGGFWLLLQRDTKRRWVLFRALYIAVIVWVLTIAFHATIAFLMVWHIAICLVYPPLLPPHYARLLVIAISISYLLLHPVAPDAPPLPFTFLRAAALLGVGWVAYVMNTRVVAAVLEHQAVRQALTTTELARQQLEKEKELYEQKMGFINLVSHEFRTPLAIIESASFMLEQYFDQMTPEKRIKRLQEIRGQTGRLAEMMDSVVTAEKLLLLPPPPAKETAIDVRQHCESIIEEMRELDQNRHPIVVTYEGELDSVVIDVERLTLIFYHLLSNALKFSTDGSDVALYVRRSPRFLTLQVIDHGVGIPEADRGRVSQPFFRAENALFIKGIGLGLSLVYESVRQQGGSVQWSSEVDKGTTFEVRLPLNNMESR